MSRLIQSFTVLIGAFIIMACQGDVGPDKSLLIGTWAQQGAAQTDPTLVVENAVITYAQGGRSTFNGIMIITENDGIPERFSIAATVGWTLEETVLTRTLQDVKVTPDISTPEADELARALENAYRNSPPGRLIIETLDAETLALLDVDTGTTLTYDRQ